MAGTYKSLDKKSTKNECETLNVCGLFEVSTRDKNTNRPTQIVYIYICNCSVFGIELHFVAFAGILIRFNYNSN